MRRQDVFGTRLSCALRLLALSGYQWSKASRASIHSLQSVYHSCYSACSRDLVRLASIIWFRTCLRFLSCLSRTCPLPIDVQAENGELVNDPPSRTIKSKMQAFVPALPTSAASSQATATTSLRAQGSAFHGVSARRAPMAARLNLTRAPSKAPTMIATGQPLEDWLGLVEKDLGTCTRGIFSACKEIAYKIRTASCDKMSCFNDFGDEQLAIDVLADKVLFDNLEASGVVATASSEEVPVEKPITEGGKFSVAFDPLVSHIRIRPLTPAFWCWTEARHKACSGCCMPNPSEATDT